MDGSIRYSAAVVNGGWAETIKFNNIWNKEFFYEFNF